MSLLAFLDALQGSALAHAISKSNHLVGALLGVLHIFGIVLLLVSPLLASLRLLGIALVDASIPEVARVTRRLFVTGLVLTLTSGTLLFISSARLYGTNWVFWWKMGLLLLAALAHGLLLSPVLRAQQPSRLRVHAAAVLPLLLWFGVGFAGRMIAFA